MKAIEKNNKIAQEEFERNRRIKDGKPFFDYENNHPMFISKNSHRKTNR